MPANKPKKNHPWRVFIPSKNEDAKASPQTYIDSKIPRHANPLRGSSGFTRRK